MPTSPPRADPVLLWILPAASHSAPNGHTRRPTLIITLGERHRRPAALASSPVESATCCSLPPYTPNLSTLQKRFSS
jgi:hypothetical protein